MRRVHLNQNPLGHIHPRQVVQADEGQVVLHLNSLRDGKVARDIHLSTRDRGMTGIKDRDG
jgi:hypothetical protein